MMTLDKAQEVRESLVWDNIVDEIDYRISAKLNTLRSCKQDELFLVQREIAVLEELRRLPEDVIEREE